MRGGVPPRMLQTNTEVTKTSAFEEFRKTHFPGLNFLRQHLARAGRILKECGESAAREFLRDKGQIELPNARPPAKCRVIAQSRPFGEWPIALVSRDIQAALYRLRLDDYEPLARDFLPTKPGRKRILDALGVDDRGVHAQ